MTNDNTHTADEITAAADGLLEWAKQHGCVFAVAAMLGEDHDGPIPAARPEGLVAGAIGTLNEAEIVVLLAQLTTTKSGVRGRSRCMTRGMEKGEPHLPRSGGDQCGEIVSRRRDRPPRQFRVAVAYRPQTPEEEQQCNDALRLLLASMVRSRLGEHEEEET